MPRRLGRSSHAGQGSGRSSSLGSMRSPAPIRPIRHEGARAALSIEVGGPETLAARSSHPPAFRNWRGTPCRLFTNFRPVGFGSAAEKNERSARSATPRTRDPRRRSNQWRPKKQEIRRSARITFAVQRRNAARSSRRAALASICSRKPRSTAASGTITRSSRWDKARAWRSDRNAGPHIGVQARRRGLEYDNRSILRHVASVTGGESSWRHDDDAEPSDLCADHEAGHVGQTNSRGVGLNRRSHNQMKWRRLSAESPIPPQHAGHPARVLPAPRFGVPRRGRAKANDSTRGQRTAGLDFEQTNRHRQNTIEGPRWHVVTGPHPAPEGSPG